MTNPPISVEQPARPGLIPLIVLGILAGVLSGLFGIGGGVFLVPALVTFFGMSQRLAAGTSVTAILPSAIVGAITYGVQGNIDWIAGACLAAGIIVGAFVGARLLVRLPIRLLQIIFIVFVLMVVVSLWIVIPQRSDEINMTVLAAALLLLTGVLTGVLSGLIGVGGGIVVVPVLMFFFGASDLIAKGTSLLMMIPGSMSGTLSNARNKNVNIRAAAVIGVVGAACSPLGALIAVNIEPSLSNILFSILLAILLVQMIITMFRGKGR